MTNDLPPHTAAAPMTNARVRARTGISHWSLGFGHFLLLLLLAAVALSVRLPRLGVRPMHCDEANQAVRTGILLEKGEYRYSPEEHHGPTLYWLTLPSLWLCGAHDFAHSDEFAYRIVPVVFGVGLVLLLLLVTDGLGRTAAVLAGLYTAVSPAMVYYSRYYIQETLLVFFTFAAIACAWRYMRSRAIGWAVATGAAWGLMHATKETWVLAAAAMAGALGLLAAWNWLAGRVVSFSPLPRAPTEGWSGEGQGVRAVCGNLRVLRLVKPLLVAALTAVVIAVAFYSSFGTNWSGPLDSLRAYSTYLRRGTEPSIHTHPWNYYFQLLLAFPKARRFYGAETFLVALAGIGCVASVRRMHLAPLSLREWNRVRGSESHADGQAGFCFFLTFYTLLLTAFYAIIPYKTPWCMLSFWQGMLLLAGVGASAILHAARGWVWKLALGMLLVGLPTIELGRECYWLNFRLPADTRNPYVYAHTSTDTLNFAAQIERLATVSQEGHDLTIHVVTPENYWPLPWYLRRFNAEHIGYWPAVADWTRDAARLPPPAVIVLSPDVQAQVDAQLHAAYNKQITFGLRPGVLMLVYVREDLWAPFLAAGSR